MLTFKTSLDILKSPKTLAFRASVGPRPPTPHRKGYFQAKNAKTVGWIRLKGLLFGFQVGQNRTVADAATRSKFGSTAPHRMLRQGDLWQRRSKSGHPTAVLSPCRRSARSEPTAPACSPCADSPTLTWSPRVVCPFADLWTPKPRAFFPAGPYQAAFRKASAKT